MTVECKIKSYRAHFHFHTDGFCICRAVVLYEWRLNEAIQPSLSRQNIFYAHETRINGVDNWAEIIVLNTNLITFFVYYSNNVTLACTNHRNFVCRFFHFVSSSSNSTFNQTPHSGGTNEWGDWMNESFVCWWWSACLLLLVFFSIFNIAQSLTTTWEHFTSFWHGTLKVFSWEGSPV